MGANIGLWHYVADAGIVVKLVMLILMAASIASWAIILQRSWFYKRAKQALQRFEQRFWSGIALSDYAEELDREQDAQPLEGLQHIFYSGYVEFSRLKTSNEKTLVKGVQRAMRVAQARQEDELEKHLGFLATVGSTSPYIGLFGTVWGIMTSFNALGSVQQASIAMVAPGISEALIATAMGLFAAIPAVIAYNRLSHHAERLMNQFSTFQEEFTNILQHQLLAGEQDAQA